MLPEFRIFLHKIEIKQETERHIAYSSNKFLDLRKKMGSINIKWGN